MGNAGVRHPPLARSLRELLHSKESKNSPVNSSLFLAINLFCKACREELNLKRSTIQNHVRSVKHVEGKEKTAKREREIVIA